MNIMLYAPVLKGHPQVYCRVITNILLSHGCHVFLVIGLSINCNVYEWPDILPFVNNFNVTVLNTFDISKRHLSFLTAEEIRDLQSKYHIQSTLFVDADNSREQLVRLFNGEAPRLLGNNVGIFSRTSTWYPKEDFYTGEKLKQYNISLRSTFGNIKRAVFNKKDTDKYFYETIILKERVLNAILVKDERVTKKFGPPVFWLPEIFKPFDQYETDFAKREYNELSVKYKNFIKKNISKDIIVFFGRGAWYRGYDFFLKLLHMDKQCCGVHCGDNYIIESGKNYKFDIKFLKTELLNQGRLFETNRYIHSNRLIKLIFSYANRAISTHRLTGSSGTMLFALDRGLPVLGPNSGLIGYRIKSNCIGETYEYGNADDLYKQWIDFKNKPISKYSISIKNFNQHFNLAALTKCLKLSLLETWYSE